MKYVELDGLSSIGVGTYRMSAQNADHCKAFAHAMASGCNLADTAVNYTQGGAEEMIGNWFHENPGQPCFIISKAGYVNKKDLPFLKKLQAAKGSAIPLMARSGDIDHCIHPDYLQKKIRQSLKRLRRKWLDGFLLHNPEYFLLANPGIQYKQVFYDRIKEAFAFLEECVHKGIIRYYGISSNTLALYNEPATISLSQLTAIAGGIDTDNKFRLIQFPFNFAENSALHANYDGLDLLQLAHAHNLVIFSNRPLNLHTANGFIRLATYALQLSPDEERQAENNFSRFIELIDKKLTEMNAGCTALDLEVIQHVKNNWNRMGNQAAVDVVFRDFLQPLLNTLFGGTLPLHCWTGGSMTKEEIDVVGNFYRSCLKYAEITMTKNCKVYVRELVNQGILDENDTRPLPLQACSAYLESGIDHVLTGMRKVEYVDELKMLFGRAVKNKRPQPEI
ncbi:MAG: aldo/keto reductase [Chitinophagaceae bacterium]